MLVAATSGRLMVLTRQLLGGFDVATIRWQDLEEVTLRVGMIERRSRRARRQGHRSGLAGRAGLAAAGVQGPAQGAGAGGVPHLPGQDQAWREKRRVRELEELRARSGGIQVSSAPGHGRGRRADGDAVRRLQEAKQMLDAKLITDAEYEAIKAKIVGSEGERRPGTARCL